MTHSTTARAVATALGCLAAAGALTLLTDDAIASGHWTLEHKLTPLIVALTLAGAHFAPRAVRERRFGYALGWAILFCAGLAAQLYTSAGKQAATATAQIDAATAQAGARTRAERRLKDLEKDVAEARRAQAAECATGHGTRCKGAIATLAAQQADLAAAEAVLAGLPVAPVAAPNADRAAAIVAALWGGDHGAIKAALVLLEPLRYTVLLEIGALVSFGYAAGGHGSSSPNGSGARWPWGRRTVRPNLALRRRIDIEAEHAARTEANGSANGSEAAIEPDTVQAERSAAPGKTPDRKAVAPRTVRTRKAQAEAEIVTLLALGRSIPSQQSLADRWGVSKSTVSDWMRAWDAAGLTRRQAVGKCKRVTAA